MRAPLLVYFAASTMSTWLLLYTVYHLAGKGRGGGEDTDLVLIMNTIPPSPSPSWGPWGAVDRAPSHIIHLLSQRGDNIYTSRMQNRRRVFSTEIFVWRQSVCTVHTL